MIDNVSDLVLDGNAGARLLQDTFGPDITPAQIRCEACDSVCGIGSLVLCAAPINLSAAPTLSQTSPRLANFGKAHLRCNA